MTGPNNGNCLPNCVTMVSAKTQGSYCKSIMAGATGLTVTNTLYEDLLRETQTAHRQCKEHLFNLPSCVVTQLMT